MAPLIFQFFPPETFPYFLWSSSFKSPGGFRLRALQRASLETTWTTLRRRPGGRSTFYPSTFLRCRSQWTRPQLK